MVEKLFKMNIINSNPMQRIYIPPYVENLKSKLINKYLGRLNKYLKI